MGKKVTDVGYEKSNGKQELKKHAATIHCSNSLSLLQRKISNALLYHAYKELLIKEEHEITVKQLCRLIGYQGNNHSAIKEALKELISTVIEWNLIDDQTGTENWSASSIIASVSLQGPLCYYAYSPRMKQLLHSPSMFGKIDLVIQSRFRSSYGLALYENCIRYRGLPHTKWFEMDMFRKLMGVPSGMYDVFRDFKRRVLDKAVDEVNTYSDLVVEVDCQREGRKVVRVRFKLKERPKKTRLGKGNALEEESSGVDIKKKLTTVFGLSAAQVKQLLIQHDRQFIQDKIKVVEASRLYQEGKVQNTAGYLLSAIKDDYQLPKESKDNHREDATIELELKELKKQAEEIRASYSRYREQVIHRTIDALTEQEKAQFMQQFTQFAEPAVNAILQIQRRKYKPDNVHQSPQVIALLRQFALRELDISLISLEEFVMELGDKRRAAWQKLKSYDPDHPLLRCGEKVI